MPRAASLCWLAVVLVTAVVLAAAGLWFANRDDKSNVDAEDSSQAGWKTVTHEDVRVAIPASWQRQKMEDCEFTYVVWRPPDLSGCDWAGGVMIVGADTFDPAHGPGVRRVDSSEEPAWGGYTQAEDFDIAVVAGDDDRKTVQRVLQSVR